MAAAEAEAKQNNWNVVRSLSKLGGTSRGVSCCTPVLAHRVNSRQRSTSVAFGAKRTEPRLQKAIYDYTSSRSHRDLVGRRAGGTTQREQPRAPSSIRPPRPAATSGWPSINGYRRENC